MAWHDAECGGYRADLELWLELADRHGDPVLDIGAGTGRVTLALARAGYAVTAIDHDPLVLAALEKRARGLAVAAVGADGRSFDLGRRFPLVIVPMQTIQLLPSAEERLEMLRSAGRHLADAGRLAIAISESLALYEAPIGGAGPLPDVLEQDGMIYRSRPTAIRRACSGYLLIRRRERVAADGSLIAREDRVVIAALTAAGLEDEARRAGLGVAKRRAIGPTADHVGSTVVILHA